MSNIYTNKNNNDNSNNEQITVDNRKSFIQLLRSNPLFMNNDGQLLISITSYILGISLMFGLMLGLYNNCLCLLGYYIMFQSLFHYLEYILTALFHFNNNGNSCNWNSFMLNHSREFHIAIIVALTEYFIELLLFPSLKYGLNVISIIGIIFCIIGQLIRSLSMYEAGSNFTHLIAQSKKSSHILIKSGLYSIVRHPSYLGWFIWSISTQFILANPICIIGYTIVVWRFFNNRILYEEQKMLRK
jgi:protein-S-isoprenylcysteine O-methyltransferase